MVGFISDGIGDGGFGVRRRATMKMACNDEDDDEVILCVSDIKALEFWV